MRVEPGAARPASAEHLAGKRRCPQRDDREDFEPIPLHRRPSGKDSVRPALKPGLY